MAEKYLKAFLQEHGIAFPRTHNLITLLNLCLPINPMIDLQRPNLDLLNDYAVDYRYPGEWADRDEALRSYRAATDFRTFMRARLGLS